MMIIIIIITSVYTQTIKYVHDYPMASIETCIYDSVTVKIIAQPGIGLRNWYCSGYTSGIPNGFHSKSSRKKKK